MLLISALAAPAASKPLSLYEQREAYRQALDELTAGRLQAFRRSRQALDDYVLAPYLDYYDVSTRLATVSDAEMHQFQAGHGELPAADILHYRWLKHLGARAQWWRLLDNYRVSEDAELRCYYLRALLADGERDQALSGVPELWTVGVSQPQACDPLFEVWINAGLLTESRAWERLQLALEANETRLARYLLRFLEGPLQPWAAQLYDVHLHPQRVAQPGAFPQDNPYTRAIIGHGLQRLARRDPAAAADAWQRLQDSHDFSSGEAQVVSETIVLALARRGTFPTQHPQAVSPGFATAMAEAALQAQNWKELLHWAEQLPPELAADLRWQYWLARALERTPLGSEQARSTYQALAEERNYYGFLAAALLGREPRLNGSQHQDDPARMAGIARLPGAARALELYAVGDLMNARREWYTLLPTLAPDQRYLAARLAQQVGWVAQSILTANDADLRDSLELRFPVAYADVFQRVSHVTTVPQPFLLAVARQESAFDPRARSPANARGLMQLMHPTASSVASRIGVAAPSTGDLYDPAVSVELGAHHLAHLLSRYDNQRALAAAAYNAGEHRVDRWVAERRGQPLDVWIEGIPFHETRNYVKNVLAFTQVYGQLLGKEPTSLERPDTIVN